MKTIIAIPDFTREAHLKKILPIALRKLANDGVRAKDIEIIIATGLHRSPTKKEINDNLGSIAKEIKVSVHNYSQNSIAYFGKSKKGIPIYLNKKLKAADSIITIGVVEPHLYAGYSGGTKVAAIGLAGEKTINSTHHPRFLDHPGTRICSIKGNPFRDFIEEVSSKLPITYSINIINDKNGNLSKVFQGDRKSSFRKAVSYSEKIFEKKINKLFDVVLCNIPKEKSINIYQASRAFNYVANTKRPILKRNALILVNASLEESFGKGLGERRFKDKLRRLSSATPPRERVANESSRPAEKLIREIKKGGCLAGEHRAYMVAKAMLKAQLGFISKRAYLYKNQNLPFLFFTDLPEAHNFIKTLFKKPKIYNLKNAFNTILSSTQL